MKENLPREASIYQGAYNLGLRSKLTHATSLQNDYSSLDRAYSKIMELIDLTRERDGGENKKREILTPFRNKMTFLYEFSNRI